MATQNQAMSDDAQPTTSDDLTDGPTFEFSGHDGALYTTKPGVYRVAGPLADRAVDLMGQCETREALAEYLETARESKAADIIRTYDLPRVGDLGDTGDEQDQRAMTDGGTETETADYEHVRNVLDTAEIGDEIVFNDVPGVVVDQHETETVGRTCLSVLVEREHDPDGDGQRYRIAATEPGRHADANVRFQRVIEHDNDGQITHTLALDTLALGDEDAIEPPTSAEQAVTDGGTETETDTDAWPTFEYDADTNGPPPAISVQPGTYAVPTDGSAEELIQAIKQVSTAAEAADMLDGHRAREVALVIETAGLPRVGDLGVTQDEQAVTDGGTDTDTVTAAMSDPTPTTAADAGPTIDADDTDDTDQLDAADIAADLGDTHWDVAEAISSADGGLTIRQLVEEHVDTKKPWTQRCARDLCDAGLVRRERDGRAYVYHMDDATAER
jgi:hypothetical protein